MKAALVIGVLSLVGCGVETGEPVDSTESEVRRNACATVRCAAGTHCVSRGRRAYCVEDEQTCRSNADCVLFDNYCDGCACDALNVNNPAPWCSGTLVQCIRQPCGGMVAACQGGKCVATTQTAAATGQACGPNVCPSGQVCCNASCGICTPPDGACIQIACAPTF